MAKIADVDVHIKEVLMPVIDNYLRTNSAMLSMGLAVDVSPEVDWSRGGKHITRVEFKGGLEAKRLNPDTPNTNQKVTYDDTKYPVIDSIIPVEANGTTLQDAFDDEGVFNRLTRQLQYEIRRDMDANLMSYTTNIGDGSTNYGASGVGAEYTLDITGATTKTLTYDGLVKARGKFGDAWEPMVLLAHSNVITDILLTTEAKNLQQGVTIGNLTGVYFPVLGIVAVPTDRMNVATDAEDPDVYTSLLCKRGCMGYAWKLPLDVVPKYNGNYVFQWDFVWRYAIMRNPLAGREMTVKILSHSATEVLA